jgi:Zn-dependent alcohol dehydrogenase
MLTIAGSVVVVDIPHAAATMAGAPLSIFFGGKIKISLGGDIVASRDIPFLVNQYLRGDLQLDDLVGERIGLGDAQAAWAASIDHPARPVIVHDDRL